MTHFPDVFFDAVNTAFDDFSGCAAGATGGFPEPMGSCSWPMGAMNDARRHRLRPRNVDYDSSPESHSYSPHPCCGNYHSFRWVEPNGQANWRRDWCRDDFPDYPSHTGTGPHFFGFTNHAPAGFSRRHMRQHDEFVQSAQNAHAQMHAQATAAAPHNWHPSAAASCVPPKSNAATPPTKRPSNPCDSAPHRRPEQQNAPYSYVRTTTHYHTCNPAQRCAEKAPQVSAEWSAPRTHPTSPPEPMAGSGTSRSSSGRGAASDRPGRGGHQGSTSSATASSPTNTGNNSRPAKRATPKALSPPIISCRNADENCAVCLEEFVFGAPVLRIPCLHQFHSPQCSEWIIENQSCPVCKLDLHPSHVHRKLRLRVREVEQMSVKELQYVCYYVGIMDQLEGAIEKSDVVNVIMASRHVTVLCPPAEELRNCSVRDLRQLTNTLGVDTKTCLDKDDLIKQLLKQHFVDTEVSSPSK